MLLDARELIDDVLLVEEGVIEQAIVMLLEIEKTVAEGAAAVPLAALLAHSPRFAKRKVGMVLTGGNIDPLTLAFIMERGLARSGRLARLTVELRDLPGSLAQVTSTLARLGANIEEVHHQRTFTQLPLQTAEVEFVIRPATTTTFGRFCASCRTPVTSRACTETARSCDDFVRLARVSCAMLQLLSACGAGYPNVNVSLPPMPAAAVRTDG